MKCWNEECDADISIEQVFYPESWEEAAQLGRVQHDFDFPVARCTSCGALHACEKWGRELMTTGLV